MPEVVDYPEPCAALLATIARIAAQGWCPATGGNFSCRVDVKHRLITRSGRDKTCLTAADLMLCDERGAAINEGDKPSDESALHARIYQLDGQVQAVLHSHSVTATVISRQCAADELLANGFEMQKSLRGQTTHEQILHIPILDNQQNIPLLADQLQARWKDFHTTCPGVLVRGHGLYAWGQSIAEAQRHLEGLEFLLQCLWQERLMPDSTQ